MSRVISNQISMKTAPLNSELEVVYEPETPTRQRDQSESLIHRLRFLLTQRRRIARFVLCGTVVATVIAFLIPPRFESTVRLMPPDDQAASGMAMLAGLSGRMGGIGMLAGDFLGVKSSGGLFIGILTSRTVQDDLIRKFDLRKVYWARRWDTARKRLGENTAISEDRKSGIVSITVADHDPQRAALLAGEYVTELNRVVSQVSTSSARREREFLQGRLKEVRDDLEIAEKDFGDFASKNTAVDIKEQAKAMVGAAATLQGELIATESQIEGMRKIYAENNVRVQALRARAGELRAQLGKLGGKYEGSGSIADPSEDSMYPSIRKLPVLGVTYADLYRRTKVQEAIFETLTQQYELAKVAEAKEIPSVKLLDSPDVPERKVSPSRLLIIFLGVFLSFAFGSIWVLGSDQWQKMDPESPSKLLAMESFEVVRRAIPESVQRRLFRRLHVT
jgi:uncharacterized protein involved in exopolysaccharide biosynthesis